MSLPHFVFNYFYFGSLKSALVTIFIHTTEMSKFCRLWLFWSLLSVLHLPSNYHWLVRVCLDTTCLGSFLSEAYHGAQPDLWSLEVLPGNSTTGHQLWINCQVGHWEKPFSLTPHSAKELQPFHSQSQLCLCGLWFPLNSKCSSNSNIALFLDETGCQVLLGCELLGGRKEMTNPKALLYIHNLYISII